MKYIGQPCCEDPFTDDRLYQIMCSIALKKSGGGGGGVGGNKHLLRYLHATVRKMCIFVLLRHISTLKGFGS
jgi:hypothetical protein